MICSRPERTPRSAAPCRAVRLVEDPHSAKGAAMSCTRYFAILSIVALLSSAAAPAALANPLDQRGGRSGGHGQGTSGGTPTGGAGAGFAGASAAGFGGSSGSGLSGGSG